MQFTFGEEVILSGMVISTISTHYLQAFRLRADVDKSAPYILDGSVFLPGNMVSSMKDITKVPPIFWMAQSFCQEIWQAL